MSSPGLPSKRAGVLMADFDTEIVVLVPEDRRTHRLDTGLSLVLSACDGRTPRDEFVAEIAAGTGESTAATERWLDHALATLRDLGVVDDAANVADGSGKSVKRGPDRAENTGS